MFKHLGLVLCLLLLPAAIVIAEEKGDKGDSGDKVVSGMSIVGNNETPKSLVIIPWKSSEIGQDNNLKSNLLNEGLNPVDKAVFMRELNFYKLSNEN